MLATSAYEYQAESTDADGGAFFRTHVVALHGDAEEVDCLRALEGEGLARCCEQHVDFSCWVLTFKCVRQCRPSIRLRKPRPVLTSSSPSDIPLKDMSAFQENDEYCPFCHNHFVIEAETAEDDAGV